MVARPEITQQHIDMAFSYAAKWRRNSSLEDAEDAAMIGLHRAWAEWDESTEFEMLVRKHIYWAVYKLNSYAWRDAKRRLTPMQFDGVELDPFERISTPSAEDEVMAAITAAEWILSGKEPTTRIADRDARCRCGHTFKIHGHSGCIALRCDCVRVDSRLEALECQR